MGEDHFLFIEETGARPHDPARKSRIKSHVKQKRTKPSHSRVRARRLESKDLSVNLLSFEFSSPYCEAKNNVITNPATRQRLLGQTEITDSTGFIFGVEDMIRLAGLPIELRGTDSKFVLHHCKSVI
jgi:hypothetical protein